VAVGIGEHARITLSVYPNPASEQLTVQTDYTGEFQIVDFSGMTVMKGRMSAPKTSLDIRQLGAGVYMLRIPAKMTSVKFIKTE
jgi:hypothetical protein